MSNAAKKNTSLEPFEVLMGEWRTVGKHPLVPNVILSGKTSFNWLENGAFIIMHSHIDHEDFPDGIAIFGSDDSEEEYIMNYFDEREVSTKNKKDRKTVLSPVLLQELRASKKITQ